MPFYPRAMGISFATAAERPDLWARGIDSAEVWPEYNRHGTNFGEWENLDTEFAEFQFVLYEEDSDEVVAEGHTAPCWWDGTDDGLSTGIDETLNEAFALYRGGAEVNTLCALAAEIPPRSRAKGLAAEILSSMADIARREGFGHLIAPVRPSWKERYPLVPIERYISFRRADGSHLDPWIRVHERLGARVAKPIPKSMLISSTVTDWEEWTGMTFPESGHYWFPQGLTTVAIDKEADTGTYWEPNVWIVHQVPTRDSKGERVEAAGS